MGLPAGYAGGEAVLLARWVSILVIVLAGLLVEKGAKMVAGLGLFTEGGDEIRWRENGVVFHRILPENGAKESGIG